MNIQYSLLNNNVSSVKLWWSWILHGTSAMFWKMSLSFGNSPKKSPVQSRARVQTHAHASSVHTRARAHRHAHTHTHDAPCRDELVHVTWRRDVVPRQVTLMWVCVEGGSAGCGNGGKRNTIWVIPWGPVRVLRISLNANPTFSATCRSRLAVGLSLSPLSASCSICRYSLLTSEVRVKTYYWAPRIANIYVWNNYFWATYFWSV